MCHQCDYTSILENSDLPPTPNRLKILKIIGNNNSPLSAQDIFEILTRTEDINRVTVYRILDLFVEKNIIDRISGGGRSFHYGLAPNKNHPSHPHFYCKQCGNLECLNPEGVHLEMEEILRTFPGIVDKVEVRLDGICKTCLRNRKESA
ncbi:MAG: Fur family transcriptional regulator [Desulfobacterales bacterium]